MCTSCLQDAILDFPFPVSSYKIPVDLVGLLDPENMGLAVEIVFLSCPGVEI